MSKEKTREYIEDIVLLHDNLICSIDILSNDLVILPSVSLNMTDYTALGTLRLDRPVMASIPTVYTWDRTYPFAPRFSYVHMAST